MKALSIRQPWANVIVIGEKTAEIRTWTTEYRGKLLIHAAKTVDGTDEAFGVVSYLYEKNKSEVRHAHAQPCGRIVGIAELYDVVQVESVPDIFDRAKFRPKKGEYAFLLSDIQPVQPVEYRGQLSLFEVPDEIVQQLKPITAYQYANKVLHLYPPKGLRGLL